MIVFREGDAAARDEGDAGVRFAGLSDASLDIAGSRRPRETLRELASRLTSCLVRSIGSEDRQETWEGSRNEAARKRSKPKSCEAGRRIRSAPKRTIDLRPEMMTTSFAVMCVLIPLLRNDIARSHDSGKTPEHQFWNPRPHHSTIIEIPASRRKGRR
jgi:hypothetical protein